MKTISDNLKKLRDAVETAPPETFAAALCAGVGDVQKVFREHSLASPVAVNQGSVYLFYAWDTVGKDFYAISVNNQEACKKAIRALFDEFEKDADYFRKIKEFSLIRGSLLDWKLEVNERNRLAGDVAINPEISRLAMVNLLNSEKWITLVRRVFGNSREMVEKVIFGAAYEIEANDFTFHGSTLQRMRDLAEIGERHGIKLRMDARRWDVFRGDGGNELRPVNWLVEQFAPIAAPVDVLSSNHEFSVFADRLREDAKGHWRETEPSGRGFVKWLVQHYKDAACEALSELVDTMAPPAGDAPVAGQADGAAAAAQVVQVAQADGAAQGSNAPEENPVQGKTTFKKHTPRVHSKEFVRQADAARAYVKYRKEIGISIKSKSAPGQISKWAKAGEITTKMVKGKRLVLLSDVLGIADEMVEADSKNPD